MINTLQAPRLSLVTIQTPSIMEFTPRKTRLMANPRLEMGKERSFTTTTLAPEGPHHGAWMIGNKTA